ncbi:MAG: DUF3291 domain-containing protein [Acidobacteriota bacterium]
MYQLAQVNIARFRAAPGDPQVAGFVARIAEMNGLAESSEGFVWRFEGSLAAEHAPLFEEYFQPFDPELTLLNMSVWRSVEDLRRFVYASRHVELLRGKGEWMVAGERPHLAMWWVEEGAWPSVEEAAERLRGIERDGPSPFAFSFAKVFGPPGSL